MTSTRSALLDAAYEAAASGDWRRTRMLDVARAAGVSRQTLYAEFGSKDALAQALAARETSRFVDGAEAAMTGAESSPAQAVAAAVEFTLRAAADDRLLKAVLTDESDRDGLLPLLTTRAEPLLVTVRARVAAHLTASWPQLPESDVALAADAVVRLTVSHLLLPDGRPDEVASQVARLVDRLLPGGSR